MPRKEGMERKDLLAANVKIFKVSMKDIFSLYFLAR
jgi:malate/lactate dehydrogenase